MVREGKENEGKLDNDVQPEIVIKKAQKITKALDVDMNLLSNRVAHLKLQLEKAKKKVQQTTERVEEIKQIKARNNNVAAKKEKVVQNLTGERHLKTQHLKSQHERNRKRLEEKKKQHRITKNEKAKEYRKHREHQKTLKKAALEKEQQELLRKVRERKRAVMEKKIKQQIKHEKAARRKCEEAEKELDTITKALNKKEGEISRLEEEEMAWIEKLKDVQQRQRVAYEALENALAE